MECFHLSRVVSTCHEVLFPSSTNTNSYRVNVSLDPLPIQPHTSRVNPLMGRVLSLFFSSLHSSLSHRLFSFHCLHPFNRSFPALFLLPTTLILSSIHLPLRENSCWGVFSIGCISSHSELPVSFPSSHFFFCSIGRYRVRVDPLNSSFSLPPFLS